MSERYAGIARTVLAADAVITAWATGGVLAHDPRRSGADATGTVFDLGEGGDIRPTIACVGVNATRSIGGPAGNVEHGVTIRMFAPDHPAFHADMDDIAARVIALLFRYRQSNDNPAQFRWGSRLGITRGGQFEDVAYDEIRFAVVGLHQGVTT